MRAAHAKAAASKRTQTCKAHSRARDLSQAVPLSDLFVRARETAYANAREAMEPLLSTSAPFFDALFDTLRKVR